MAQLACRFTFLDVLLESEERVMAVRGAALRARSAPPSRGWSPLVGPEVAEDQAEMQFYVSTLLPSIGMVPPVTGADLGTWASGRFRNWTSGAAALWSRCPDSNSLP